MPDFDFRNIGLTGDDLARAGGVVPVWVSLPGEPGAFPAAGLVTGEGVTPVDAGQVGGEDLAHWAAHPEMACQLLAGAYQTIARDEPFLLIGEPASALSWIRFLWLALPPAWAGAVPMLSYTRSPLRWASPAVIAGIPGELTQQVLAQRREAVIGDLVTGEWCGKSGAGRYLEYARHIAHFLAGGASRFLDARARIDRLLPNRVAPDEVSLNALPFVLSLASEEPLPLPDGPLPVDVSRLVAGEDLALLPTRDLLRLMRVGSGLRQALGEELAQPDHQGAVLAPSDWDAWVVEHAGTAVRALLVLSHWEAWRRQTHLDEAQLRNAALAWCSSDYWKTEEPFLEHWKQVVRDLGWLPAGASSFSYPVMEWFADEQRADLAGLARGAPVREAAPRSITDMPRGVASPPLGLTSTPADTTSAAPAWEPFHDAPESKPGVMDWVKSRLRRKPNADN